MIVELPGTASPSNPRDRGLGFARTPSTNPAPQSRRNVAFSRWKPNSCLCIPKSFHNWGTFDKVLFVLCLTAIAVDLFFEVLNRVLGRKGGESAAEAEKAAVAAAAAGTSPLEDPLVWFAAIGVAAIGTIAFFVNKLRGGGGSSSSGRRTPRKFTFSGRDRNAGLCRSGPDFRKWSAFDKILLCLAVMAIVGDLGIEMFPQEDTSGGGSAAEAGSNLRGAAETPAETPKEEVQAELKEDPKAVAASIESAAKSKFAKSAECTADQLDKVQKSGITGDACRGKPYTQQCSFTKMTTAHKATWLSNYAEEISAERAGDETSSFVAVFVGDGCGKIEDELYFPKAGSSIDSISKKPKLICTKPSWSESVDFATKWGLVKKSAQIGDDGDFGAKTLDKYMAENDADKTIKDAVFIRTAGDSIKAIGGGWVTLARTRYVEFEYDWQDGWTKYELQRLINEMDDLAFTCYWPGDGKLWRITGCWQPFYGFKSYSTLACVNRNLAPKLAEGMEKIFTETIG